MKKALLLVAPVCLALATLFCWEAPQTVSSEYTSREVLSPLGEAAGALWYNNLLRANPATGKIDQRDVMLVKERVNELAKEQNARSAASEVSWKDLGPDNIGGRTRAIWSDSDAEYWIGSVSGGVWHTTNAGNTWAQVETPSNIIGSICRMGNGTLVIGTGNTFESGGSGTGGSGFIGAGLFYSEDNGASWTILEETEPTLFMSTNDSWNEINALIPDPNDNDGLWIGGRAGLAYWDMGSGDVQVGGFDGLDNGTIQDMSMSVDGSVFLVASGTRVYRSTNDGGSFTLVSGSSDTELPQNGKSRVRIRVSQTDSDHCFAAYAANNGAWGGVWYSGDAGQTWSSVWTDSEEVNFDPAGSNAQGYYDLALGIDPVDPTVAYCAGVTLWKVGANYNPEQIALNFAFPGSPLYVHSDIHEIHFTEGGTMLIGCDGGMHRSTDYQTFTQINRGYNVTQFYAIAHSSGLPVLGGTQDNGTLLIWGDDTLYSVQEAVEIGGGDGFDTEITQVTQGDNIVAYTTVYRGQLRRIDSDGGGGMFYDDEILALQNEEGEIGTDFFMDVRLFEDTEDDEAEQYIILINPSDSIIYDPAPDDPDVDAVLDIQTLNLNIDHFYRLDATDPDYAPLMFWDSIARPAFDSEVILTESPEPYWWLDLQTLEDSTETCLTDSTFVGIQTVIDQIIPIIECEYIEVLDSTLCFETGADTTYMDIDIYDYDVTCSTVYHYGADVHYDVPEHRKIQDRYSSITTAAFSGTNGMWMTRQGLNLNLTPDWFQVVSNTGVGVKTMEYSSDGNHLFYSNYGSNLFRLDGIDQLWTAEDAENVVLTSILGAGGTVTGIACDPNDPDHIVITVGGYGTNSAGKVRESFNATSDNPTFSNIWFASSDDLSRMPVYDAVIDVTDSQRIMVGTEFGAFVTLDGGDNWEMCNGPSEDETGLGIGLTPIYDLRQQEYVNKRFIHPENVGVIYAGTHGRGIHASGDWGFVGVDEQQDVASAEQVQLNVYPNPTLGNLNVEITLDQVMDVTIDIFAADGRWVKTINKNNMFSGSQTVALDVSDLSNGNYILRVQSGASANTARFVVMK